MQRKAIQLGSPAYTSNHSRKYTWFLKVHMPIYFMRHNMLAEWQLYRGQDKFPRTCIMSYAQAIEQNKKYTNDFTSKVNDDPERKLWEWKLINTKEHFNQRRRMLDILSTKDLLKDEKAILKQIEEYNKRFK